MGLVVLTLGVWIATASATAEVRVSIQDALGRAQIKYECTAGEIVRAFAVDVTTSQGQFVGISDFFVGESTVEARGYGIFPASFRDQIVVKPGANPPWAMSGYTPLAEFNDDPDATLPGLNSAGVTLEFGGLWHPATAAAIPPLSGLLGVLQITEASFVSITDNPRRGGIVAVFPDTTLQVVFTGGFVDPNTGAAAITGVTLVEGVITIQFQGGELESAPTVQGEWVGTGNQSGIFQEVIGEQRAKFYRVRSD